MMVTELDLLIMYDPALFESQGQETLTNAEVPSWRAWLKGKLYEERRGLSDLSFRPLQAVEMHEGILSRARVPASVEWHWRIFCGANCFLLLPEEHQPQPPDTTTCYWIAVARYGMRRVEGWLDTLPLRSQLDRTWAGTRGTDIIYEIPRQYEVAPEFWQFYREPVIRQRLQQTSH